LINKNGLVNEMKNKLEQMTWQEAGEAYKKCKVAVLPTGSHEQHGPYLPICMDAANAIGIADELAKKVKTDDVIFLPPFIYGYCDYHTSMPGTLSLREYTLRTALLELLDCVTRWGVKRIFIINTHGGNSGPLKGVAQELRIRGIACAISQWWEVAARYNTEWGLVGHSDINEISAMYKWHPDWVVRPAEGFKDPVQKTLTDKITINDLNNTVFDGVYIQMGLRSDDVTATGAMWEYNHGGTYVDINQAKEGRIDECIDKVTDYYLAFLEEFKKIEFEPVKYPCHAYNYDDYR